MNIVINSLKKAKDRRERITKQLEGLNLEYVISEGIDGQLLSEEEKNKYLSLPGGYREGEKFQPGEIGCTMTHINSLKMARENKWPYVIVLEDDVVLAEDFEKRIKHLLKILPSDWEHVYLSTIPRTPKVHDPMINIVHVEPSVISDCISATMIRDTAYDKIIDYLEKFETTTDDSIIAMIFRFKNLISYTYYPFVGYVDDNFTYIWNHDLKREHKSKQYFKNII